jgi:hypothetical protein
MNKLNAFGGILIRTVELHLLYLIGKDESDYADSLRDKCDPLFYKLNEEEAKFVGVTSEEISKVIDAYIKKMDQNSLIHDRLS